MDSLASFVVPWLPLQHWPLHPIFLLLFDVPLTLSLVLDLEQIRACRGTLVNHVLRRPCVGSVSTMETAFLAPPWAVMPTTVLGKVR